MVAANTEAKRSGEAGREKCIVMLQTGLRLLQPPKGFISSSTFGITRSFSLSTSQDVIRRVCQGIDIARESRQHLPVCAIPRTGTTIGTCMFGMWAGASRIGAGGTRDASWQVENTAVGELMYYEVDISPEKRSVAYWPP